MKYPALVVLLSLALVGCGTSPEKLAPARPEAGSPAKGPFNTTPVDTGFNHYWFQGQAEIAVYEVQQDRYDSIRPAQEVMVFVTEDFSERKQVKLDAPEQAGADRVPVLKLNAIRRFHTGIYDYSLMQSVFTPLDAARHPFTLKTSTTVQDWCGQVFAQMNLRDKNYQARNFSYFENEGDVEQTLPAAALEDELWLRIRLNPAGIQPGRTDLIPSAWYARLRHQPQKAEPAELSTESGPAESVLQVRYLQIPRSVRIRYATTFPHRILGWEERDGDRVSSQGSLRQAFQSPYWMQHNPEHDKLREALQLNF
ncbi:MAG TPA: hypothetical protein PKL15_10370 [Saprospiraceae bacterium]|nr:hypothetical protein [Saprospiraceae bacterium]